MVTTAWKQKIMAWKQKNPEMKGEVEEAFMQRYQQKLCNWRDEKIQELLLVRVDTEIISSFVHHFECSVNKTWWFPVYFLPPACDTQVPKWPYLNHTEYRYCQQGRLCQAWIISCCVLHVWKPTPDNVQTSWIPSSWAPFYVISRECCASKSQETSTFWETAILKMDH